MREGGDRGVLSTSSGAFKECAMRPIGALMRSGGLARCTDIRDIPLAEIDSD